jgi:hypothetical protein
LFLKKDRKENIIIISECINDKKKKKVSSRKAKKKKKCFQRPFTANAQVVFSLINKRKKKHMKNITNSY